jgi:hypothetical protein
VTPGNLIVSKKRNRVENFESQPTMKKKKKKIEEEDEDVEIKYVSQEASEEIMEIEEMFEEPKKKKKTYSKKEKLKDQVDLEEKKLLSEFSYVSFYFNFNFLICFDFFDFL